MSGFPVEVAVVQLASAEGLPLPTYATPGSAGVDLAAAVREPVVIPPGGRAVVPTGIAIALPVGFEAQVRPRSGLAAKAGVTVLNTPGTVDSDYRGEIQVILANFGERPFAVGRGERIAQLVVAPVTHVAWRATDQLPETARGAGGFGSTGTGTKE
jgi:dUTP pyrophosphatase